MEQPKRIQRKRTKGWKMPENCVSVTRPGRWGNPYVVGSDLFEVPYIVLKNTPMTDDEIEAGIITPDIAKRLFRTFLTRHARGQSLLESAKIVLRSKHLACWCKEGEPCHADVLLELANRPII